MTSRKFATTGNFLTTTLSSFMSRFFFFFFSFGNMNVVNVPRDYQIDKNENFVRSRDAQ